MKKQADSAKVANATTAGSRINKQQTTIIRVLIVEDSLTVRRYLEHIIASDPQLEVVGMARDGEEGVKLAGLKRPDIVTMDINMPKMNGYEATRRIMAECPVPIVVVTSSWHPDEVKNSFRAIGAGALTALEKPPGPGHPKSKPLAEKLVQTLKTMSEVRVVRRFQRQKKPGGAPAMLSEAAVSSAARRKGVDLVAVGASTGGPPVLKDILSGLGRDFPVPILIVQHMAPGFLGGMVEWLDKECGLSIRIALDGEHIRKGVVYFAPDASHMGVKEGGRIIIDHGLAENGLRPAVSFLFRAAAKAYGPRCVGVLLTGMGKDGAQELKEMKDRGATTLIQNKESCVVFGMPGEAAKINAANHVVSPEGIVSWLNILTGKSVIQGE